ncbi:Os01g0107400, partial [Oryza sativa Japonica Group]
LESYIEALEEDPSFLQSYIPPPHPLHHHHHQHHNHHHQQSLLRCFPRYRTTRRSASLRV